MSALAPPQTFESLRVRYRIRAELVALTGLRVGAGKSTDAAATDQPVIRDALGRPYIPGSSLKGVLRSGLEAVLRGVDRRERGLWACDLFAEAGRCVGDSEGDEARFRRGEAIGLDEVIERTCTACSLFGSSFLAGRLFVHDLPRLDGAEPEVRDGVGIHRDLGNAAGAIKYDVEVVPPDTRFRLEMLLENVDTPRLALVLQALEMLHDGELLVGGMTSRGLGRVEVRERTLEKITAERLLLGEDFEALDYDNTFQAAKNELRAILRDTPAGDE